MQNLRGYDLKEPDTVTVQNAGPQDARRRASSLAGTRSRVTAREHRALAAARQGKARQLRVAPVDSSGQTILEEYERLFDSRTRLAAFTPALNALGTITPAEEMADSRTVTARARWPTERNRVSHQRVDVAALDADFHVFSGHEGTGRASLAPYNTKQDIDVMADRLLGLPSRPAVARPLRFADDRS